jgi:hypothetical protein
MPGAEVHFAQARADEFRRSDAKLRAMSDLLAYLDPTEAAAVASEISRDLLRGLTPQEGRLQMMPQRFAIVPIPDGPPPPEAIVVGGLDEIMQFLPQTVAYQELEQRALGLVDQLDKRERALSDSARVLTESVGKFMDTCGRLVDGEEERAAEQVRLDEEEKARAEAAELRDWLDTHPEPGSRTAEPDDTGGELHSHGPVDRERYDPEAETDAGGVPLSYGALPESYIKRESSEDLEEPGIGGASNPEPDPADLDKPQPPKQVSPAAVSLW